MEEIDLVRLNFSNGGLQLMNIILGFIVFGVALNMKVSDFREVLRNPKAAAIGLFSQFILFPAITFLLIQVLQPIPSIALGMILIASCPGGNLSNFLTHYARGNAALSVSMSAISTASATIMTPLNMAFWGGLYLSSAKDIGPINLSFVNMLTIVVTLLIVPTIVGMLINYKLPKIAKFLRLPMQRLSILFFLAFVVFATYGNWDFFLEYYYIFFSVVILHNLLSLSTGYGMASLFKLSDYDKRAVTIEVGIQNSGLGLIIIFNEFDGLGGMAIVAAAWGICHIVSGLTIAHLWRGVEHPDLAEVVSA